MPGEKHYFADGNCFDRDDEAYVVLFSPSGLHKSVSVPRRAPRVGLALSSDSWRFQANTIPAVASSDPSARIWYAS